MFAAHIVTHPGDVAGMKASRTCDCPTACRRPQVRYILLNFILPNIGDRPDALRHQNVPAGGAAILLHHQFGQVIHVAERPRRPDTAKPGKPFGYIIDEAGFADFAVRDNVDANVRLPANQLVDGLADHGREGGVIDFFPFLFGVDKINQLLRPRQAAGMGGQDMIAACLHRTLLPHGNSRATCRVTRGCGLARDGWPLVLRGH